MRSIKFLLLISVITFLVVVPGCKKAGWDAPEPQLFNFTINVRDHMTNEVVKSIVRQGYFNQSAGLTITYSELIGSLSRYTENFFAVREEGFGKVLGFSLGDSSISFDTTYSTTLDAYVLVLNPDANYEGVLKDVHAGLVVPRNASWNRVDKDGQTGPESVWESARVFINNYLWYTGSISAGGDDFAYGYGHCDGGDGGHDIPGLWVRVNNSKGYNITDMTKIAINETGGFLTRSSNKVDFNTPEGKYALKAYMCFAD